MANRVKVIGYAKREFYNNNIEYRNFSDGLVGNQFTSDGGTTLFTLGNFSVTTNLDGRLSKIYRTSSLSKYYSLNKLKIDDDSILLGIKESKTIKLNIDRSEISNYAYFGSMTEFLRVSIEKIIKEWPASLYVSKVNQFVPGNDNLTFENYVFNPITNEAIFEINANNIKNEFGINLKVDNTFLKSFNVDNKLRDMNLSFPNYVISLNGVEYPIVGFQGLKTGNKISFTVQGDPFGDSGNVNYHIKPTQTEINKFFIGLNDLEKHLLNRNTTPKYKAEFNYVYEADSGAKIIGNKTLVWPVTDGYNIDFQSSKYIDYVNDLLDIAKVSDDSDSNIITNRLISKSIIEFDTVDGKMDKTLKVYGRNFDELKKYIDGIRFINHISYDKKNNVPDRLVKNLARTMGWELTSSLFDIDFNGDFLSDSGSLNLSPVESEIEFWRRLILNTPWIWKSKGTRKVIEFLLRFVGTPKGLVKFNEYVYKASNTVDVEDVKLIFTELGVDFDEDAVVIDGDGFPRVNRNNNQTYYQMGGQWYRQTSGSESNIDINKGNNPHIGPYDNGFEYLKQFNEIVPNFGPLVVSRDKSFTDTKQIFLNYDGGKFNIDDINSYIQVLTKNNLPIDPTTITVNDEMVTPPKPINSEESNGASYKISISRSKVEIDRPCDYTQFSLSGNGLVLFTHSDSTEDYNISSECCSALNFTPELDGNNQYVCRWKAIEIDPCSSYSLTSKINSNGYHLFINGDTGALTDTVPTSECCTAENLIFVEDNGSFHCKPKLNEETPTCSDYIFTGDTEPNIDPYEQYAIFEYNGGTTNTVLSAECCVANDLESILVNGGIRCIRKVEDCSSYIIKNVGSDGYVVFQKEDGLLTNELNDTECCTLNGYEAELQDNGKYKCTEPKPTSVLPRLELIKRTPDGDCSLMDMKVYGEPNSTVKYRVLVEEAGSHGFLNTLNYTNGTSITPSSPSATNGSYCEGSINIGSTGVAAITMNTCAKPPLRESANNCTTLQFSIYDYDFKTIKNNNKLGNTSCSNF